jgi:hypothetical protein
MAAVAHNPAFAKKVGISQSVGKEFAAADKGKTFKQGGVMATKQKYPATTPMGKVKTAAPSRDGVAERGKTKGKQVKMAGSAKGMKYGGKAC